MIEIYACKSLSSGVCTYLLQHATLFLQQYTCYVLSILEHNLHNFDITVDRRYYLLALPSSFVLPGDSN
jgi:hypothetical protein